MSKSELKKVGFEAPLCLVDAIQDARNAKRRYKDKMFSNRLVYEIGAKILLEIDDDEAEEYLDQRLTDVAVQISLLNNQKKLLTEKKKERTAEKRRKEEEFIKMQQTIESVASKIREYWEKITLLNKAECIDYIVNICPEKLTRERVVAVFPDRYCPIPTEEEALQRATSLLGGDV